MIAHAVNSRLLPETIDVCGNMGLSLRHDPTGDSSRKLKQKNKNAMSAGWVKKANPKMLYA